MAVPRSSSQAAPEDGVTRLRDCERELVAVNDALGGTLGLVHQMVEQGTRLDPESERSACLPRAVRALVVHVVAAMGCQLTALAVTGLSRST